ncbi:porin [Herbaspirillum sp. RV1423]|uniref:porin n=1 Tax=Herbaspirillum sp. RV1423 TaxID=1443993 RepID=UPI0004BA8443|nr:porin [Herbaspirillum sp. RV1423]
MKRIIYAAATAGILSLTATVYAQSQVTVYGLASAELLNVSGYNSGTVAAPALGTARRLDNSKVTNSRIGFRGTEDLGGGTSAFFTMEAAFAIDTGAQTNASSLWSRGSYVGLKNNSLGALSLGRQWGIEDQMMGRYFIGAGYAVFQYREFGYVSDLIDNSIKYVSPSVGGFSVQALAAPGENVTGFTKALGVNYVNGPFEAGATYRSTKNLTGGESKQSGLGVSYSFGALRLHAGYGVSDPRALVLRKAKAYDLGLQWDATANTSYTLDYVKRDQIGTNDDSFFVRLQATYQFTKRSSVFVNLVTLKNDGIASERFYGNGASGVNQSVISLGVRHAF